MNFYPGDRVRVFAHWHSRVGECGTVSDLKPGLWVTFDGDKHAMTCEAHAVVRDESEQHMTAGG